MADKPKIVKMNSPLGTAKWPKLTEPDYGTKDYPKPEGEYSVKLVFSETDPKFIAFREKLEAYMGPVEAMADEKFAALKKPQRDKLGSPTRNDIFTTIYDEDDEPTGEVEMKLTMKASGVVKKGPREGKKWSRKPQLFDALGRPIKGEIAIWGGSELIISFSFTESGYFIPATGAYGIKLQLEAAQVVTLRQGGERSASDYGFGAQEGGFDSSQYEAPKGDDDEGEDEGEYNHTPGEGEGDPSGADDF
ncbi:hypothetical protein [Shimia sp.]|uniref:hypothetical protein n=1 Tax=Shimia sp. TaxID=1954381 RepID=UPI003BAD27B0